MIEKPTVVGRELVISANRKETKYFTILRLGFMKYTVKIRVDGDTRDWEEISDKVWNTPEEAVNAFKQYNDSHFKSMMISVRKDELEQLKVQTAPDEGFELAYFSSVNIENLISKENESANKVIDKGDILNGIKFIEEAEPTLISEDGELYYLIHSHKIRNGKFECPYCNSIFIARICGIQDGNIISCGCLHKRVASYGFYPKKYALLDLQKEIFSIWQTIKDKCYNKNHPDNALYKKRKVKVCDEWREDFPSFYHYVIGLNSFEPKYIYEAKYGTNRLRLIIESYNSSQGPLFGPGKVVWAFKMASYGS